MNAARYYVANAPQRGERVRYAVRREAAHERSRSTAPVGLRRMRELRNCHFSGNFVTEAAHCLGAAETTECRAAGEHWVFLKNHEDFSRQFGRNL